MKNIIYNILKILDKIYINHHLLIFGDYTGIASFCFHTVFENDKEKNNNHTLPNIGLTLDEYKYIFDFFKNNNYKFISTKDYKNLNYGDKCIHVTFDDGYFNTTKILPILKDYEIPIDFFIVGNNFIRMVILFSFLYYSRIYVKNIIFSTSKRCVGPSKIL